MKKTIFSLALALFSSAMSAFAVDAEDVQVTFILKKGEGKVERIMPQMPFLQSKEAKKEKDRVESAPIDPSWQFVRFPIKVEGRVRGNKRTATLVPELKVHMYLVFDKGDKKPELILMDKEVTYVDIPLNLAKQSDRFPSVETAAAVFISPTDAKRICGDNADGNDLSARLVAMAVDASFNTSNCMKADERNKPYAIVNTKKGATLKGAWWKKEAVNGTGAELRAINETPFAPFYSGAFPATSPLYATGDAASSSMGYGGMGVPTSSSASSDTEGYTPDAATSDSADAEPEGGKKKKSRKRK